MNDSAESIVLKFFELISFPGIRKCEGNTEICRYLRENNTREASLSITRQVCSMGFMEEGGTIVFHFILFVIGMC
jgi:hypothetical protein